MKRITLYLALALATVATAGPLITNSVQVSDSAVSPFGYGASGGGATIDGTGGDISLDGDLVVDGSFTLGGTIILGSGAVFTDPATIGVTGDTDLIGLTADAVTFNGTIQLPNLLAAIFGTASEFNMFYDNTASPVARLKITDAGANVMLALEDDGSFGTLHIGNVSTTVLTDPGAGTVTVFDASTQVNVGVGGAAAVALGVNWDVDTSGNVAQAGTLSLADNQPVIFGTDSDIQVGYDETTDDRLEWDDGTNLLMSLEDVSNEGALYLTGQASIGIEPAAHGGGDPGALLDVTNTAVGFNIRNRKVGDALGAPSLYFNKAKGTVGSETVVADGDVLGGVDWGGYSGAAADYKLAALIKVTVDGEPDTAGDTTDMPTSMTLATSPDGSSTATPRLHIDSAGAVTIGGTVSTGGLAATTGGFSSDITASNGSLLLDAATNGEENISFSENGVGNIWWKLRYRGDSSDQLVLSRYNGAGAFQANTLSFSTSDFATFAGGLSATTGAFSGAITAATGSGIATVSPAGVLQVGAADASAIQSGAGPNAQADTLVLAEASHGGITVYDASGAATGNLWFADNGSQRAGGLAFEHATDSLKAYAGGNVLALTLDGTTVTTPDVLVTTSGFIEDTDAEDLTLRTNANASQIVLDSAGAVVIGAAAPTTSGVGNLTVAGELDVGTDITLANAASTVEGPLFKITAEGGYAILLTNREGGAVTKGRLVQVDTVNDDSFVLTGVDDNDPIGVVYDASIADDATGWIVVSGVGDVAFDDNVAAVRGYWVETSEAGYADNQASAPGAVGQHFQEVGHCVESVSAGGGGTHILARCVIHFL